MQFFLSRKSIFTRLVLSILAVHGENYVKTAEFTSGNGGIFAIEKERGNGFLEMRETNLIRKE